MLQLKAALREAARPIVRPVWRRIWARIETRVAPVETRLAPIETRVANLEMTWDRHVPLFLNAVSSVGAFGWEIQRTREDVDARNRALDESLRNGAVEMQRLSERVDTVHADGAAEIRRLWERVEFVRRELLFDMRYGRRQAGNGGLSSDAATPPVRASAVPERIATMLASGEPVRLNLGCGHMPLPGYVNVDRRDLPGVDVVADAGDLPFEPGTIAEISSAHLLEHFPQEMIRRNLLPYWRGLLSDGGCFRAVVPDGAAMTAGLAAGTYPFEDYREVLFGAQDYDGDFHFNLFTPDSLRDLLEEADFREVKVPVEARRNGKCFEFEIVAHRTGGQAG